MLACPLHLEHMSSYWCVFCEFVEGMGMGGCFSLFITVLWQLLDHERQEVETRVHEHACVASLAFLDKKIKKSLKSTEARCVM